MAIYRGPDDTTEEATIAGVSSFNTRAGLVSLLSSDVTNALGYTPVNDSSYVHTDNNYTTAEQSKLAGIEAGAQVNVAETDPVYVASTWYSTTNNSSNWDTAFGWGNHASAGYLTSSSTVDGGTY